ncbi:MAG: hypothetical protein Q4D80_06860, partial [Pseudomonadota bacterium]|nr:hypothetical protein [Pseudomonadota bacterium]
RPPLVCGQTRFPRLLILTAHTNKKTTLSGGLFIGEQRNSELARKSVINLNFFLAHSEEILAMKEQVKMIKELLAA